MAILDQSYSESNKDGDNSLRYAADNAVELGQGFTPSASGTIPYVELYIRRVGSPSGNIFVKLETNSSGKPSDTVLATSANVSAGGVSTSYSYVQFTFSAPTSVVPGTIYHIVLAGDYTYSAGTNVIQWGYDGSSPSYAGGVQCTKDGATWNAQTRDFCFKQYYDPMGGAFLLNFV